jgi:hypothetical protein
MSGPAAAPEVEAYLYPPGEDQLVIDCPWCGGRHFHGAGADPAHPEYGHREYVLVPARRPPRPPRDARRGRS